MKSNVADPKGQSDQGLPDQTAPFGSALFALTSLSQYFEFLRLI